MQHAVAGVECMMKSNADPVLKTASTTKTPHPKNKGHNVYLSASKHSLHCELFAGLPDVEQRPQQAGKGTCPGLDFAAAGAALLLGGQKSPQLLAEAPAAAVGSPETCNSLL